MAGSFRSLTPTTSERGVNQKLSFISSNNSKVRSPAPYSINFELIIITNYIDEGNQILEQILPYFTPYCMTTINLPEIGEKFDMKVKLDSVAEDQEFSLPEDDYRTLSWTLSFTADTMIFKPIHDVKIINEIHLNYRNMEGSLMEKHKVTDEVIEIQTYENLHGLEDE